MFSNTSHLVSAFSKRAAKEQGGLLSGKDPTAFNEDDPIRLWIIQLGVIIAMTQLLSMVLGRIRQPKVIAEVLGGILLGPTAFGAIPGFTDHIFPKESTHYLSLTANIGLCLFLFLVGLEIDTAVIKRNAKLSISVSLAGMVLPFGLGAGLAVPLYKRFVDPDTEFTHFMLFTSVAYSITAFPVLCRILTELKLLDTTVGIVVLSAGVGNDIVGWTLLALSVALVNAGSGLTALWILLTCVGWTLFLLFPVRHVMRIVGRKTGSIETGQPTMVFMTIMFLLVFGSAFFTDVIGVHAIFGAFLTGLIIPRDNGLTIALTEKFEDMVSIIFLPLYFTLSGLSTNLRLLNDGITWGYTIAICITAFFGKFFGCTMAAKYVAGFNWRESGAVGSLMSCKGLVELIVLNVGLSAGILSQRVFSMFVLEALVLTFMTTPLVTWMYPPHCRKHVAATGANFDNVADQEGGKRSSTESPRDGTSIKRDFMLVVDRIEHIPAMMAVSQLVQPSFSATSSDTTQSSKSSLISLSALRLIELSDRTSAVMKSSVSPSLLFTDPLLSIFRMFARLSGIQEPNLSTSLEVVPYDGLVDSVVEHAQAKDVDMVLLPWVIHTSHSSHHEKDTHTGDAGLAPPAMPRTPKATSSSHNPFEQLLRLPSYHGANPHETSVSAVHSHTIRGVFARSSIDVGLYIELNSYPSPDRHIHHHPQKSHHRHSTSKASAIINSEEAPWFGMGDKARQHLIVPFFGGPDDRMAVEFVMGLCSKNEGMSATIVRFVKSEAEVEPSSSPDPVTRPPEAFKGHLPPVLEKGDPHLSVMGSTAIPDTIYAHQNTETRLQSDTADNILWSSLVPSTLSPILETQSSTHLPPSTSRIQFHEIHTPTPLHALTDLARSISAKQSQNAHVSPNGIPTRTVVVLGRSRRMAVENHRDELKAMMQQSGDADQGSGYVFGRGDGGKGVDAELRKTVGDVASACLLRLGAADGHPTGAVCGLVVVQSAQVRE